MSPRQAKLSSSLKKSRRTSRPAANGVVEARLRKLGEFYDRGLPLREKPRIAWAEQDEDATSGRAELLRKARAFADPVSGYSPKQFEQLCRMCRRHGFALGIGAVIRLLSVPDRHQRESLQKQAIKSRWTNERLVAEIRARFARSKPWAGKHVRTPADRGEALYRLGWVCNRWNGLYDALGRAHNGSAKPVKSQLPRRVREHLERADSEVKALHKAVLAKLPLKNS